MNDDIKKASDQAAELSKVPGDTLAAIARAAPCVLLARGVALRQLTHAQAMAGLEAAEEALRFISKLEITYMPEQGGIDAPKVLTEPVSAWEARAGLAKVLKAIEGAQ